MRRIFLVLAIIIGLIASYYGIWHYRLSDDVARIEATMKYHNDAFRAKNRWVTLKADSVKAHGFPFESKVRVTRPTLTFVWGQETFGASLPWADFSLRDTRTGTYDVLYSPWVEGVYARNGQAPEEYKVTPKIPLPVLMRAQGDSRECSIMPGQGMGERCPAVGETDPLISYALKLPSSLTVTIESNGQSKEVMFQMMQTAMPIYMRVPAEMDRPLELFINILREAMISQRA